MTVPNEVPLVDYVGNGETKEFNVPFQYETSSTLFISVNGVTSSTSDYLFNPNTGNFVFYTAPVSGAKIRIIRDTPEERDTDYDDNYNTFRPRTLNKDFDRLWRAIQEHLITINLNKEGLAQEILNRIQADEDMLDYIMNQDNAIKQDYIQRDSVINTASTERDNRIEQESKDRDSGLKNYIDNLVALITGDPSFNGITTDFVTEDGETQRQKNDKVKRGIANIYDSSLSYNINDRVLLDDGTEVISTIASNTNNPNVDMTGWVNSGNKIIVNSVAEMLAIPNPFNDLLISVKSYNAPNYALKLPFSGGGEFVYNSSKSSINDGGIVINGYVRVCDNNAVHVDWFGADPTGNADSTTAVNNAIKSISGRTESAFVERKPTCAIEYGAGLYMQGDVVLTSCTHFKGQGSTVTQLIPNSIAGYIFKTVGSFEGEVITSASRLVFCNISGMTLGYGYVNAVPMVNSSAGGMLWEATSWCHLNDVNFCGIGGIAFRLKGVWDSDFSTVTFFNNGYATNSTSLMIESVDGSNDGSNAITFTRSHFEGNYRHFEIFKNSRHIFFNWAKIEAFTAPSEIYDPQGVYFNNLEASSHDKTKPMIGHHSTDGYTPFVVEYNNPSFFGAGYYLYSDASYPVKVNGGSSKEAEMIANGQSFRISNHFGYFCGNNFINANNSTLVDCEFKYTRMGSEPDDIKDSIIMSGNSKVKNLTIEGVGTSTDNGRAFLNASSSVTVVDSTFMAGSQYAIRGTSSENKYNNTAVTQLFSDNSAKKSLMLNVGNGNQYGGVSSQSVSVPRDTLITVPNIVAGSTIIQTRADNVCNCVLLADSWSGTVLLGKSSAPDIVVGGATGASNDGKIYIFNTGSSLNIMNRTASDFQMYVLAMTTVS